MHTSRPHRGCAWADGASAQRAPTSCSERDWSSRSRIRRLGAQQAQLPPELLLGVAPAAVEPRRRAAAVDASGLFESLSLNFEHAVDMTALAAMLTAPPLRLLRAKGLMRDRDDQSRSLQLVGARCALAACVA
jgi:hypothetical protein